jgi:hypothetical protein
MKKFRQIVRYLGGAISLSGLLVATAFIGWRTADPVVDIFLDRVTLPIQIFGIVGGLILIAVGLVIVGQTAPQE